ncbi:hypothetical protein HZS_6060, partial [Henneguya salminicola]
KQFIFPVLEHPSRLATISKKNIIEFNVDMRQISRDIIEIPLTASMHFIHSSTQTGGLGIRDFEADTQFQEIRRYLIALNDKKSLLGGLVRERLMKSRRSIGGPIPLSLSISDMLSIPPAQEKYASFLHFSILAIYQRKHLEYLWAYGILNWQGKLCNSLARCPTSNKFITAGDIPPTVFKWALAARCDLLPTKSSLSIRMCLNGAGMACRLCGKDVESVEHILNKCKMNKNIQILRHDDIISLLIKYASLQAESVLRINKKYPFIENKEKALRPDILILNNKGNSDYIIDVSIAFDSNEAMANGHFRKVEKYSPLNIAHVRHTGRPLIIIPFIIGSLGSIHPACSDALKVLGINLKESPAVLRK